MIIFSLTENNQIINTLTEKLNLETGIFENRNFPDDETYIRIDSNVKNKSTIIFCSLDHPNNKILLLYFMAKTLKNLGANNISLISPYLPYMRQDKQFQPGEAITSSIFAKLISSCIDQLITIDPHLHRIKNISDIYSCKTITLHATKAIGEWIQKNIYSPLIIGPDEESTQWVAAVAKYSNCNYVIAKKTRLGDKKVVIEIPEIKNTNINPIIVDDIISTGTSIRMLIQQLKKYKLSKPICIAVHALFNQETQNELIQSGAARVISCNTVTHPSNEIDISSVLLEGINKC